MRVLRKKNERKYDSCPTSYINNARIINFRIIWQWNNPGIENSRIVPKMREWGHSHVRMTKKNYCNKFDIFKLKIYTAESQWQQFKCFLFEFADHSLDWVRQGSYILLDYH